MAKQKKRTFKPAKTKMYRGIQVDATLDPKMLDRFNIKLTKQGGSVRGICAGHNIPTELDSSEAAHISYQGKKPHCEIPHSIIVSHNNIHTVHRTKPGRAPARWWKKVEKCIIGE